MGSCYIWLDRDMFWVNNFLRLTWAPCTYIDHIVLTNVYLSRIEVIWQTETKIKWHPEVYQPTLVGTLVYVDLYDNKDEATKNRGIDFVHLAGVDQINNSLYTL